MKRYLKVVILIVMLSTVIIPENMYAEQHSDMAVHFIDVGQGDSMLIQTPGDKNILIDGGRPKAGKKVVTYLKEHDVKKIDLMIATHPDIDHIGGLVNVLKAFRVGRIIDTGKIHSTRTYASYISEILRQQIPFEIAVKNDGVKIAPLVDIRILNTHSRSKTNNESSIVLKVTYDEMDFLLMSDVEKEQEKKLIEKYKLNSEILKVAHHGSHTSTSLEFLKAVSPNAAILTYGTHNKFGHPVDRVVDNLQKVDTAIYPTAVFGTITVRTDGEEFMILNERNPTNNLKAS